jgi:Kef-type K+ transport system membrane component KefB
MFSSTILVLKLLPTTTLHQKRMGAVCISVLILEDLLAIGVLVFVRCFNLYQGAIFNLAALFLKLSLFVAAMLLFERFVLWRTMKYVDRIHEALFILGLAWCFGIATIAYKMGLFFGTGAFFAGVILARHRISFFISESLKPLRDFFLVLFFFSLGAQLDFTVLRGLFLSASILAVAFIILKPWIFKIAFVRSGEKNTFSKEVGIRLGQLSEFSLLIAILAFEVGCITHRASQLIQMVTIITFVASSYIVVFRYPTPIGTSEKLLRD